MPASMVADMFTDVNYITTDNEMLYQYTVLYLCMQTSTYIKIYNEFHAMQRQQTVLADYSQRNIIITLQCSLSMYVCRACSV